MTASVEEAEAGLIESVGSRLQAQVAPELADACVAFTRQLYRWVAPEDVAGRTVPDLCNAAMAAWEFALDRAPGCASVRAYTPRVEEDGLRSATLVEVVTDDMPFLVDSVGMELSRQGYGIRFSSAAVIEAVRSSDGRLVAVSAPGSGTTGAVTESVMQLEIDRETDSERLDALATGIRRVLGDVRAAVEDWPVMRGRLYEIVAELKSAPPSVDPADVQELGAFLSWLDDGNFIFLGYREYDLVTEAGEDFLQAVDGSGLGILRGGGGRISTGFARLAPEVRSLARAPYPLILTKANSRSTVHRPLYLDYIGVKRFDAGEVCGERRFLGLYTTAAERANPREIPIVRGKVERVMRRAAFPPEGHHAKSLARTLASYPRDELFQATEDELFVISMGIVALGERRQVRLFARPDPFMRFVACLVFLPRDRYNTENRERIASVLSEAFGASEIDWGVRLSESKLARIHYVLRTGNPAAGHDVAEIERRIARVTRPWSGRLADALSEVHGEERANALFRRYGAAFPIAYQADWPARAAVVDVDRAEVVAEGERLVVSVYESGEADETSPRCKLLSPGRRIALSDVLPIFENMGLRVGDERPYELKPEGREAIWIYDIGLVHQFDIDLRSQATRAAFQDAFAGVWTGRLENDRLGALVLGAGLTGREVSLLRALVKYLRQAGTTFSDHYLQQALTGNPTAARLLVELFGARLDPHRHDARRADLLAAEIDQAIAALHSRDQARVLRDCLAIVRATVRTNYFQPDRDGHLKTLLSLKLDPELMPFLPSPRPRFETFVYSPRVEGVYLRHARVARGGIRLSDRREDFRAEALEVLGAQTVRNAVIVPDGASGAFVTKGQPSTAGSEGQPEEAADCYRLILSGLLDVTDNIVEGKVVAPPAVIRHDEDDAYLMVATNAGSAAYDALSNDVVATYGFWLGDSFDAAGSQRYRDQEMDVTARGAWESVARHLRDLGMPVESDELSVIGIGEVSGRAPGAGMVLSPHVKLIGAFDGNHVFLDPRPDPQASFAERRRLFDRPSSSWLDYDRTAISEGGGVFARSAAEIPLSAQARQALEVEAEALAPDELIRALLRAPVGLLWSSGTGTFVKATSETNSEVADKTNDAVRINAAELRCRVVGEASSGGFTQRARIEYAVSGGRINTDAIDAAAGLKWSDYQMNLSILLDAAVADGKIPVSERDELLARLADAVADRVVSESYGQALALSLERDQGPDLIDLHARLFEDLARRGLLEREHAELPGTERIGRLRAARQGLPEPELALLLAHAKVALTRDLLASDVPEDQHLRNELVDSFPASLRERFRPQMRKHRLRREIIATDLANSIVDRQGTTFVSRLAEETGAEPAQIARAYAIAVAVFEMRQFWREVEALDRVADQQTQVEMLQEARRLVTRAARWLVDNRRTSRDIAVAVADYRPAATALGEALPDLVGSLDREHWDARMKRFARPPVPAALGVRVAAMDDMFFTFDIVESARGSDQTVERAAGIHFGLDRRLELTWLRDRILELPRGDLWQALARSALRNELYEIHRALTAGVLADTSTSIGRQGAIDAFVQASGETVGRYLDTLREIRTAPADGFTTLLVAVRELARLIPPA